MRFESIAALLAVTAQSVHALSTLSTRVGVATTTVTATSFETATSTITSVAEVTSVATTCVVGTTAPTLVQYYASCTESVWSSAGQYWQQHCSASLVGGSTIRAYAYQAGLYNLPISYCAALNSLNIPASKCAGINVRSIGPLAQYFLVNGDVSFTTTTDVYTNRAIAVYTTNPCEVTATATTTEFYPVAETSAVVYTSTYEVTYLETITVSIPDPSTTSSTTTSTSSSSSAIPLNTTSSAAATTAIHPVSNATSTLSFVPVSNTTTSSIVLSISNTSLSATTRTLVPVAVNGTTTSSIVLSIPHISLNITTQTLVPVAMNTSKPIAALPKSNVTVIDTSLSNHTSTRPSLSSSIPDTASSIISAAPNITVSTKIPGSTSPSPLFLNTTTSSNIQTTTSSSPIFQNYSSSNSAQMPYLTSSASVVIAIPALSTSATAQTISASVSSHMSQTPVTLTRYITEIYPFTACPPEVTNCPESQKSTFLTTEIIVTYSTVQAASPTQVAQSSGVHASESGSAITNPLSKTKYTTSTLYSTMTQTVTACPSSVKDCPASEKTVYQTEVIEAYTTVCPVAAASSEGGLHATSSIASPSEASLSSIASSSGSVADATHSQSNSAAVPAVLPGSSVVSSKIISGSKSVAVLTVGGTRTYTADGKIMTSTRGSSAVSVALSASFFSVTAEVVFPTVESSSSIMALVSSSSSLSAVSGYPTAVYYKGLDATTVVISNKNSSAVAMSTAKSSAATSAVMSPSIALYTGAASALKPHSVSWILGAVFASLGLCFTAL